MLRIVFDERLGMPFANLLYVVLINKTGKKKKNDGC